MTAWRRFACRLADGLRSCDFTCSVHDQAFYAQHDIAGLRLEDRWAGWTREPFNSTSGTHVSVYGR